MMCISINLTLHLQFIRGCLLSGYRWLLLQNHIKLSGEDTGVKVAMEALPSVGAAGGLTMCKKS